MQAHNGLVDDATCIFNIFVFEYCIERGTDKSLVATGADRAENPHRACRGTDRDHPEYTAARHVE